MFDFTKYNLGELHAIMDIMQYIDEGGRIDYQMQKCNEEIDSRFSALAEEVLPDD